MINKKIRTMAKGMLLVGIISVSVPSFAARDISHHWGERHIEHLMNKGIIHGYEDGTFRPNNNMSREEVVKLLEPFAAEIPEELTNADLKDISNSWNGEGIQKMIRQGLVSGYEDGTFKPNKPVTRGEFATIVYKAEKKLGKITEGEDIDFKDLPKEHWAYDGVCALSSAKFISGYEDGTFRPNKPITRGEAASILALIDGAAPLVNVEEPDENSGENEDNNNEGNNYESHIVSYTQDGQNIEKELKFKRVQQGNNEVKIGVGLNLTGNETVFFYDINPNSRTIHTYFVGTKEECLLYYNKLANDGELGGYNNFKVSKLKFIDEAGSIRAHQGEGFSLELMNRGRY